MPEQAGFESGNKDIKKETGKAGFTRRKFLKFTAATAALEAAIPAGLPASAFGQQVEKRKTPAENIQEVNEFIEKEKAEVKRNVALGLVGQDEYEKWLDKNHAQKGRPRLRLLREANPYAEQLLENDRAITSLATARVFYSVWMKTENAQDEKLPYWHNLASAYVELGTKSEDQVKNKLAGLFHSAKANEIKVSSVPTELIMYCLIDNTFAFSLSPEMLEAQLNEAFPTRKQYPPTHNERDSYAHYNDLSVLDIFELNRLKAVITQLEDRNFVAEVFKYRDEDVKDTRTGFGGVIPLPLKGYHLQAIPADTVGDNNRYVVPDKALVEMFASAATFRFNATRMNEPPGNQGPSAGDEAFFAPGVVFSSINDSTILVHFYTSTAPQDKEPVKNEVVCIGVIKKPALPLPENRNRERYFPPLA